jgi:toxin ParE1/3/4
MARRIEWTHSAVIDLSEIADYIAKDSRRYAGAFVRRIRDTVRTLKRFPDRGAVVPEFGDPTIRELSVHGYRIIYRRTEALTILGVIHGARDLKSAWTSERRPR